MNSSIYSQQAIQSTDEAVLLHPIKNSNPFSFSMFETIRPVSGYAKQGDVIVENDGVFSISSNVETSFINLDSAFKQLVDSVLF